MSRRRNKPGFIQVFESDLQEIGASCEHPANAYLVWIALCRLENWARSEREDHAVTVPIRCIADAAGLKYRATKYALDHLEGMGLVRVYRQFSNPNNRQPDAPSTYELHGALRDYEQV